MCCDWIMIFITCLMNMSFFCISQIFSFLIPAISGIGTLLGYFQNCPLSEAPATFRALDQSCGFLYQTQVQTQCINKTVHFATVKQELDLWCFLSISTAYKESRKEEFICPCTTLHNEIEFLVFFMLKHNTLN